MTAESSSTIGKPEMCGSLLIKKIISFKLRWNILRLLLVFSPWNKLSARDVKFITRGNMLTFQMSQSVQGNEAVMTWKTPSFTHTSIHCVRHGQPSADSDSGGHVRWIRAMPTEIAHWVSCAHHQTNPNSSFVYSTSSTTFPSQGLNDSSSTMFPGGVILQPNRTKLTIWNFSPFIESNFSFTCFPTVMFLLDPFGPPTVPALQMCGLEFPIIIWPVTHFWTVSSHGRGTGVPSLRFRHTVGLAVWLTTLLILYYVHTQASPLCARVPSSLLLTSWVKFSTVHQENPGCGKTGRISLRPRRRLACPGWDLSSNRNLKKVKLEPPSIMPLGIFALSFDILAPFIQNSTSFLSPFSNP